MLSHEETVEGEDKTQTPSKEQHHHRRPKQAPLRKEARQALQLREEREARQTAIREADRQREEKRQQRDRFRKAMTKARTGGKDHRQRKLGRESKVLLAKVQRIMDD